MKITFIVKNTNKMNTLMITNIELTTLCLTTL